MTILLDESVPRQLAPLLSNHHCATVQSQGWGGKKNGELLQLAGGKFDALITADQNIQHQQNLAQIRFAILLLSTNDLRRIRAAAGVIRSAVDAAQAGMVRLVLIP